MTPSAAELVRGAAARLRNARFARIFQYTSGAGGERTSLSRGQVDFATGIADLELPALRGEGGPAMAVIRPPRGYFRRADGSWMPLPVLSEDVSESLRWLESEALVATEREETGKARAFDVRVEVEDAQRLRGTVWLGNEYLIKLEQPGKSARIAGVEFTAIGEPLALLSVPEDVTAWRP
jgi:hypothetical protein